MILAPPVVTRLSTNGPSRLRGPRACSGKYADKLVPRAADKPKEPNPGDQTGSWVSATRCPTRLTQLEAEALTRGVSWLRSEVLAEEKQSFVQCSAPLVTIRYEQSAVPC